MIFNMTGGGSGSGATLVVSCPANVTVTVSKDDKSYTKNSGDLGSATFKGLTTGTWTVEIQSSSQTATRNIVITSDYVITIAFFSAYINITYPANSTCTVANKTTGEIVGSDTNTGASEKTWACIVGATGTYTITATATDGSGKSKSVDVSITADGQIVSVSLSYAFYLFQEGAGMTSGYTVNKLYGEDKGWSLTNAKIVWSTNTGIGNEVWFTPKVDLSGYRKLCVDMKCTARFSAQYSVKIGVGPDIPTGQNAPGSFDAYTSGIYNTARDTYFVNIESVNSDKYIKIAAFAVTGEIYNVWLE